MKRQGSVLNVTTYTALISSFAKDKQPVLSGAPRGKHVAMSADEIIYNDLISACEKGNQPVLLTLDVIIYSILISACE